MILYAIIAAVVLALLVIVLVVLKKKARKGSSHPAGEQLYVGNLSYHANTHHLKTFFSEFGEVQNVRLIKNNRTGRSKGFAFVTYCNAKDAQQALTANGREIKGRPVVIRMAKPREE